MKEPIPELHSDTNFPQIDGNYQRRHRLGWELDGLVVGGWVCERRKGGRIERVPHYSKDFKHNTFDASC